MALEVWATGRPMWWTSPKVPEPSNACSPTRRVPSVNTISASSTAMRCATGSIVRFAALHSTLTLHPLMGFCLLVISCQLLAQVSGGPPTSAPESSTATESGPGITLKPVEVVGVASDDTETRRRATAAKIVIGLDDIERYGDSTVGEVLKRLPGITMQGRPGRGGAPRMRGLGGGYTQILVDGERVPRGFSLDDLSPEQIERIEILRAPTAETGARAIAGIINIITRGGYTKHVNNLNVSVGMENGHTQPGASW